MKKCAVCSENAKEAHRLFNVSLCPTHMNMGQLDWYRADSKRWMTTAEAEQWVTEWVAALVQAARETEEQG